MRIKSVHIMAPDRAWYVVCSRGHHVMRPVLLLLDPGIRLLSDLLAPSLPPSSVVHTEGKVILKCVHFKSYLFLTLS